MLRTASPHYSAQPSRLVPFGILKASCPHWAGLGAICPLVTVLVLAGLALLCVPAAGASDSLVYHWPRYTTGPAQITVVPSTDPGHALDPGYFADLKLAVDNWNFSGKVHLTLAPPALCYWQVKDICVLQDYEVPVFRGGYAGVYVKTYPLIQSAQVHVNAASIPPSSPADPPSFWESMILCHELGEALGLPDPSDSPVTGTVAATCLTRDYSLLASIPSAWNYLQLDTLYANVDLPPASCKRGKKCR